MCCGARGREFDAELAGSEEPPLGSGGGKEGLNIGDSSAGEAGGVIASATLAEAEDEWTVDELVQLTPTSLLEAAKRMCMERGQRGESSRGSGSQTRQHEARTATGGSGRGGS